MTIAIDPNALIDYVSKADRQLPEDEQTVWQLRPLTLTARAKVQNMLSSLTADRQIQNLGYNPKTGDVRLQALEYSLAGCRNFRDSSGTEIEFFSTNKNVLGANIAAPHPKFLERIPADVAEELMDVAMGEQSLTPEEAKNS